MRKQEKQIKKDLINKVIEDIWQDRYNNENYIFDLLYEALSKRTIKELNQILYGK